MKNSQKNVGCQGKKGKLGRESHRGQHLGCVVCVPREVPNIRSGCNKGRVYHKKKALVHTEPWGKMWQTPEAHTEESRLDDTRACSGGEGEVDNMPTMSCSRQVKPWAQGLVASQVGNVKIGSKLGR